MASGYLEDKFDDEPFHLSFYKYGSISNINPESMEQNVLKVDGVSGAGYVIEPMISTYTMMDNIYRYTEVVAITDRSADLFIDEDFTLFQDGRNVTITSSTATRLDLER